MKRALRHKQQNGQTTQVLPPSELFRPLSDPEAGAMLADVPTKRAVWRIVLTAVIATLVLIGLTVGGYALYHQKTTEISHLKNERNGLLAANAALSSRLATTHAKLGKANLKLTKTTKGLIRAKKNLTKLGKDLAAANELAAANYSAGYGAGNSSGYSSGVSVGLVQGSDQLACSDDPDVTWLPYCY
ncbi:MAG TPA: hypothetical protein VK488_05405 [Gaiellaceae bacterium]|nr:hypothetical protein [Gaiellaceae bacterium]